MPFSGNEFSLLPIVLWASNNKMLWTKLNSEIELMKNFIWKAFILYFDEAIQFAII